MKERKQTKEKIRTMIGFYDYAVIAVFVVFMAGIGVY